MNYGSLIQFVFVYGFLYFFLNMYVQGGGYVETHYVNVT